MKTTVLGTWEEFGLLAGEWNDLLASSRADTIFLTWEWVSSWVRRDEGACRPLVIVVRGERGGLAGVAPYYCAEYQAFRTLPVGVLRVVADRATGAEYANWIVRRDDEKAVSREIARALRDAGSQWDLAWMPKMRGWDGSSEIIVESCRAAGLRARRRACEFAFMRLPDTREGFLQTLTDNRREQLKRQARALGQQGRHVVRRCRHADELPRFLDALFTLNARRWSAAGISGTFIRKPEERDFYLSFAPKALERGWLRCYALEAAGEFRAVQLGYLYGGVYHQLQEGFDPGFSPGVGNVLRLEAIEQLIAEGVREYDFLGEMTEHKRRWTAQRREGLDVLIAGRGALARLLNLSPIWPTGRFLRPATSAGTVHG